MQIENLPAGGGGAASQGRPRASSELADSIVMVMAEGKRAAGATPSQRVAWTEYLERERRGEVHV